MRFKEPPSCLDSAYERKAVEKGLVKDPVFKENRMCDFSIFSKDYDGESLYDLHRDIGDSLDEDYNPNMKSIPLDEYGMPKGTFSVEIKWRE